MTKEIKDRDIQTEVITRTETTGDIIWVKCRNCFSELAQAKSETLQQVEKLIIDEMLIAQKEGQPTSRLTSLTMKMRTLKSTNVSKN